MAVKKYREFIVVADNVKKDENGFRELTVQVFRTPGVGEGKKEVRKLSPDLARDLAKQMYRLEYGTLGIDAIIALGEALADLLLPVKSRELFIRSLDKLEPHQGLRLRLRLDPQLADIPWEYIYIRRGEGEKDTTGFLALDPRISIVRHEALPVPGEPDTTPRTRRVLAALACPEEPGYNPLNLERERENMDKILHELPNINFDVLPNATIDGVNGKLQQGADIFHFAGHGGFRITGEGASFKSIVGEGVIVLVTDNGASSYIPADQLAVNLRGNGVQLVVLGACQTGRRDGKNVWSGVAAALMEVGIPAAVAMQYEIWDEAAIAFGRGFYQALATGSPLDWAVSAGRLAIFNLCHPRCENPGLGKFWCNWGVPVLYLRSEQDILLPAIKDDEQRRAIAKNPRIQVNDRIGEITSKGKYTGVEAGVMEAGTIEAHLEVNVLKGKAVGVTIDRMTGGRVTEKADVGVLEGELTGVKVGDIGGPSSSPGKSRAPSPEPEKLSCPNCGKAVEAEWKFCPKCRSKLTVSKKYCTNCGGELTSDAKFCAKCGKKVIKIS